EARHGIGTGIDQISQCAHRSQPPQTSYIRRAARCPLTDSIATIYQTSGFLYMAFPGRGKISFPSGGESGPLGTAGASPAGRPAGKALLTLSIFENIIQTSNVDIRERGRSPCRGPSSRP